jgi:hypothetical protein
MAAGSDYFSGLLGALVDGSRAADGGEFVSMRVDEAESGSEASQAEAGD